mgnify:FL=1
MGREGRAEAEDWEGAGACEEPVDGVEDAEGRGP